MFTEGLNFLDDGITASDNLFYNDEATNCSTGEGNDIWLTLISEISSPAGTLIIAECD